MAQRCMVSHATLPIIPITEIGSAKNKPTFCSRLVLIFFFLPEEKLLNRRLNPTKEQTTVTYLYFVFVEKVPGIKKADHFVAGFLLH